MNSEALTMLAEALGFDFTPGAKVLTVTSSRRMLAPGAPRSKHIEPVDVHRKKQKVSRKGVLKAMSVHMLPGGAQSPKIVSMIGASKALSESKRNRLAGMSCSPSAISGREDIQRAFQMLFNDKTDAQLKSEATWAAGRMDADQSGDAVDGLKRKMRASMAQRGGNTQVSLASDLLRSVSLAAADGVAAATALCCSPALVPTVGPPIALPRGAGRCKTCARGHFVVPLPGTCADEERALCVPQDWDVLFARYDRDGSGELDLEEFIKAVRKENGITIKDMDNALLKRLFRHIDVDRGGSICAAELKDFIAWKPKLTKAKQQGSGEMPMSPGSPACSVSDMLPSPGTERNDDGTEKCSEMYTGAPVVAEYICISRAVLRETTDISSRKVGYLSVGETVAVVRTAGLRLKCIRLRWGADLQNGWASRETEYGDPLLEKLPRVEWSAVSNNDTAIAHRVSSLTEARTLIANTAKYHRNRSGKVLWTVARRHFKQDLGDAEHIRLDINTDHVEEVAHHWYDVEPVAVVTPRRRAAAARVSECASMEEVSLLLDTLENHGRDAWATEMGHGLRQKKRAAAAAAAVAAAPTAQVEAARPLSAVGFEESYTSHGSGESRTEFSSIDRVLLRSRRRRERQGDRTRDYGTPIPEWTGPRSVAVAAEVPAATSERPAARAPKHLAPTFGSPSRGEMMAAGSPKGRKASQTLVSIDTSAESLGAWVTQERAGGPVPEPEQELGVLDDG